MGQLEKVLQQLLGTLCPQCAAAVEQVLGDVRQAVAQEVAAKHDANKAASEAAVKTTADAEAVLKGETR